MTAANRLADPFASLVMAEILLEDFTLYPVTRTIFRLAARHFEPRLGSLDAIHVATALQHRPFDAFVTYDMQQAVAARKAGLPVVSPGMKK
jgi:predicted nucleic acid-binding protein